MRASVALTLAFEMGVAEYKKVADALVDKAVEAAVKEMTVGGGGHPNGNVSNGTAGGGGVAANEVQLQEHGVKGGDEGVKKTDWKQLAKELKEELHAFLEAPDGAASFAKDDPIFPYALVAAHVGTRDAAREEKAAKEEVVTYNVKQALQ